MSARDVIWGWVVFDMDREYGQKRQNILQIRCILD